MRTRCKNQQILVILPLSVLILVLPLVSFITVITFENFLFKGVYDIDIDLGYILFHWLICVSLLLS